MTPPSDTPAERHPDEIYAKQADALTRSVPAEVETVVNWLNALGDKQDTRDNGYTRAAALLLALSKENVGLNASRDEWTNTESEPATPELFDAAIDAALAAQSEKGEARDG